MKKLNKIKTLQQELHHIIETKGTLTDDEVITLSQKLDQLIAEYLHSRKSNQKSNHSSI